jgi:7-carboxy-7-deazaguanine synthase
MPQNPNQAVPSLVVNEIFYSLQGESNFCGQPFIFIRLTGCNLRCSYCDSRYAYDEGAELSLTEILDQIAAIPCQRVLITGGEPMAQANVLLLMQQLLERGKIVLIETNGSLSLDRVPSAVIKVVDVKCPGSGMIDSFHLPNLSSLTAQDQLKFIIGNEADYDWTREFCQQHQLFDRFEILFSPVCQELLPRTLAAWILRDHLHVRLQLQLHKIIWPDIERGV